MAALRRSCFLLSKLKMLNGIQMRFGSALYHPIMLGIPNYKKRRMQMNDDLGEYKEKFLGRLRQIAASEDNKVYLADLVSLIGIAEKEEEIDLVLRLVHRFRANAYGPHERTFGIDALRLLHCEDRVEEAFSLFMDDRNRYINPIFRCWGCVLVMTDMLYKREMYQEIVDLFHLSRESLWGNPQNIITAVLASLYKMNTEAALKEALYILNDVEKMQILISKRSVGYLLMLTLNLNHPMKALELMSSGPCADVMKAKHTQVINFKLLALIQLKRIEEAFKILEGFLKDPTLEGELPLFSETINKLEAKIPETDKKRKLKFTTFKRALYRAGLVYPKNFNDYVSEPIYSRQLLTSFLKSEYARVLTYETGDGSGPKFEVF